MASFDIVNRSTDGSTFFSQELMGSWLNLPIINLVKGRLALPGDDYMTVYMTPTAGFPQLYFKLYGDFKFITDVTSIGIFAPFADIGSTINKVEVVDAEGKVYSRLSDFNFAINSRKTVIGLEPNNTLATSFGPGETFESQTLFNSGDDLMGGSFGADTLAGYGGNDRLYGGDGADYLLGGDGGDTIYGYTDGDLIDGGADFDFWSLDAFYNTGQSREIDLTGVTVHNIECIKPDGSHVTLSSVQIGVASRIMSVLAAFNLNQDELTVVMGPGSSSIDISNVSFFNWNNSVNNASFDYVYLKGNNGANVIKGSYVAEFIYGEGGNDTIYGGDGVDDIFGGNDHDTLYGEGGADVISGDDGNDNIFGGASSDNLYGNAGMDNIWSSWGRDELFGGDGVDFARYDDANWGNLSLRLDNFALNVGTPAVGDRYTSIEGLVGGAGNDVIIGDATANFLFGSAGADFTDGQLGNDYLNGGVGADRFRFSTALNASSNMDTIADFNLADDTMLLENAIFTQLTVAGALSATQFKNLNLGAIDADDRILYNDTTGALFYDADGSGAGAAIQFALLTGSPTVTVADFFVV
ncbi:MAG: calcium-binding protein [Rhizobiaceae bacterium]